MCVSDKFAPQIPKVWCMPKITSVYSWGKYAKIEATYEALCINKVARIAVHRWWWWHRMMMPKLHYIYWVGHLDKSVKNKTTGYIWMLTFRSCKKLLNMYGLPTKLTKKKKKKKKNKNNKKKQNTTWNGFGKVDAGICTLNNSHFLCITDYHSKFPIIQWTELLIRCC